MAITAGDNLNSVPLHKKQALSTNYLDLSSASNAGWGQQYVPDLMEKEAEVFGPRTISGFLAQVGAEESMTADQVVWSEQGRLHLSYKGDIDADNVITIQCDIDENNFGASGITVHHGIRENDTVIVANSNGVKKCLVTGVADGDGPAGSGADITVAAYDASTIATSGATADKGTTVLVYGSEFAKGVGYNAAAAALEGSRQANEPQFTTFTNKPIIMKDYYEVSGSDASRIGWVEVSSEEGASGYLWYVKAESDTRARFNDYVEMSMLESVKGSGSNGVDTQLGLAGNDTKVGTQGLFDAIQDRGNVTSGISGVNAATDLAEFDAILAEFDKQGAIEENMLFVNRASALAIDDMLASMNSYGAGGTSYGVFDNDEDMALNLGFSGFRRGSYDFYKSDFRYLNDLATRGGINAANASEAIRGVIIPAGTSSVYDQTVGSSIKRPFLHVRYRASQTDDRRMKSWVTGSVGAATSALDAMQLHMLTERCLITQGANNFMLMK
tara:strand:- start:1000 stop:2499 length:1500 start_codon:yes stop_codon:yes gene_type:complete